jgi:dTMP kinase
MYKRKSLFITFEGIEGSGKSYQSEKLFKNIKKRKIPSNLTREPGGTIGAEKIRKVILDDYFYNDAKIKFDKYTDTLLYLAARNEHIKDVIKPAILKKKIIICDRFTDSTLAYQVYGKKVNKILVDTIHKYILNNLKPDLTFILKVNISKAMSRLNKRKKKNRYDKFTKRFYTNVQNAFLKIAKKNKKRYFVLDNSTDSNNVEKVILEKFIQVLSK